MKLFKKRWKVVEYCRDSPHYHYGTIYRTKYYTRPWWWPFWREIRDVPSWTPVKHVKE